MTRDLPLYARLGCEHMLEVIGLQPAPEFAIERPETRY